MKMVKLIYKDQEGLYGRTSTYEAGPYDPVKAKRVARNLSLMGVFDIKTEVVQDERRAA